MDPRAFYESPLQQPALIGAIGLALGGAAAVAALRARPADPRGAFLARWVTTFALVALIDAYLTGYSSPLAAGSAAATVASIVFVVLGDLRVFLLLSRFTRSAWSPAAFAEAFAWAFAPSLAIGVMKRATPWLVADLRHLFLVYELMALALLLAWQLLVAPRRAASPEARRWLTGVAGFAAATYALWIAADLVIIAGASAGWALRVVPNALYYGLFVAWAWRTAPRELRA